MNDDSRKKLINRIQALQQKTVENGCTEEEALSAASMAARLLDEYGFSQDDIRNDADPITEFTYIGKNKQLHGVVFVINGVMDFCDCKALTFKVFDKSSLKVQSVVKIIGRESDATLATYLLYLFHSAFNREWKSFVHKIGSVSYASARKSFDIGMSNRICERLREMKRNRNAYVDQASGKSGYSLVVVKNAAVTEEFAKRYPHTKTTRTSYVVTSYAYMAGRDAGNKVSINTGIGANPSFLLR